MCPSCPKLPIALALPFPLGLAGWGMVPMHGILWQAGRREETHRPTVSRIGRKAIVIAHKSLSFQGFG